MARARDAVTTRALRSLRLVWALLALAWRTLTTRERAPEITDEDEARERIKAWTEAQR